MKKSLEEELSEDPAYDDLYGTEDNFPTVQICSAPRPHLLQLSVESLPSE